MFPTLKTYESHRFEFHVPVMSEINGKSSEQWFKVTEEAWESFTQTPPDRLRIQVEDQPGQAKESELDVISDPSLGLT